MVIIVGYAQQNPVTTLDTVLLRELKIRDISKGYKVQTLTDSVIKLSNSSLTTLLRYNSTLYLRENGIGGTSSISFRGTTAAQTAVIWNGVNVNSQLNGQTDFNTITPYGYDQILIRSGGGSAPFGTGAIGGSIHLNNSLVFSKHFSNTLDVAYASFDTRKINYKTDWGNDKMVIQAGVNYVKSANDYKYLGTPFRNQNGDYRNVNVIANAGYLFSKRASLKLFHTTFLGRRNFSGLLSGVTLSPSNDGYRDKNIRTQLRWKYHSNGFISKISLVHLNELYRFYDNNEIDVYTFGRSDNIMGSYQLSTYFNKGKSRLDTRLQYSNITAKGTNFAGAKDRKMGTALILYTHRVTDFFEYGVNIRQEFNNIFDSPFLFGADAAFQLSKYYKIKVNGSRNYRIPTYNDLFWLGPGGIGNADLRPETSIQSEIGQELSFKKTKIALTSFYIDTKDLIRWSPINANAWSPDNVNRVQSYGLESEGEHKIDWINHHISINAAYSYTRTKDNRTGYQSIYTPMHTAKAALTYKFKKLSFFYQLRYTGKTYTTTDNSAFLAGYDVSNMGLGYQISNFQKVGTFQMNAKVNNLYNEVYQNVGFRPMPNRNYEIQLTFNF